MLWSTIQGLDSVKKNLHYNIRQGHAAHAQLFVGAEGHGALALALAYATVLHCEALGEHDACGTCFSCVQSAKLMHPDTHFCFPMANIEISKSELRTELLKLFREFITTNLYPSLKQWSDSLKLENKQLSIPVEEIRSILQEASLKPYRSAVKVFVIWLPEYMNQNAANALLKLLEEPPSGTYFLLVSKDVDQLLATIVSRCQLIKIPPFAEPDVLDFLKNRYPDEHDERLHIVAKASDGNMLHAIELLEHSNDLGTDTFLNWMRACYKQDPEAMLQAIESLIKLGKESLKNTLLHAENLLRDTLMVKNDVQTLIKRNPQEIQKIIAFSKSVSTDQIGYFYQEIGEALAQIERNANVRIVLFDLSVKLSRKFRNEI